MLRKRGVKTFSGNQYRLSKRWNYFGALYFSSHSHYNWRTDERLVEKINRAKTETFFYHHFTCNQICQEIFVRKNDRSTIICCQTSSYKSNHSRFFTPTVKQYGNDFIMSFRFFHSFKTLVDLIVQLKKEVFADSWQIFANRQLLENGKCYTVDH